MRTNKTRKDGKAPIYLKIRFNKERVEMSTGIFVNKQNWDDVLQNITPPENGYLSYNNQLQKIRTDFNDIYNRLVSLGDSFGVEQLKKTYLGVDESKGVLDVFRYYLNTIESNLGKGYSYQTLKHYRVSYNKLSLFIEKYYSGKDYSISKINFDFLNKFDLYIKSKEGVKQNTAWNYHKHLRRVLNLGISLDCIQKNPYSKFKVKQEETHREFLTMDELKKIEAKEFELIRLTIVRDIFVFACYTGLSYSDISKLSSKHLQKRDDGNLWIVINRTKTNSKCMIPLFQKAISILRRYEEYPDTLLKGKVLPALSNQKLNSYLKEIADMCSIRKNLSMHIARHTFATTVTLSNGVPIETVSKMLGHKDLKVTQVYAKILETKISNDMYELQKKLNIM